MCGALKVGSVCDGVELIDTAQSATQLGIEVLHVAVVRRNRERGALHSRGLTIAYEQ
jgi:hypothetical protein